MSYYPDLRHETWGVDGDYVRAIGWLDDKHHFETGSVSLKLLGRIEEFAGKWGTSTRELGWGFAMGPHDCELCNDFYSAGKFGVPSGDILYVAPEMLPHYITKHDYLPPKEFLTAIGESPIPGTKEYSDAVAPFAEEFRRRLRAEDD